jgi:uncharacterized protein (TIGR03083 family)
MTALLGHVGTVHRWVGEILETEATARPGRPAPPEGFDATLDWYQAGLDRLVSLLEAIDPDEAVWNWFQQGPGPSRFWSRRMAHETAMHRWDAQAAAGDGEPISADLAADGIDEYLTFAPSRLARRPVPGLEGSLHLHATDSDGEWAIDVAADGLQWRPEHAKGDAALRGPVSDLLLWMLNRVSADAPGLEVFGDRALVDRWRELKF